MAEEQGILISEGIGEPVRMARGDTLVINEIDGKLRGVVVYLRADEGKLYLEQQKIDQERLREAIEAYKDTLRRASEVLRERSVADDLDEGGVPAGDGAVDAPAGEVDAGEVVAPAPDGLEQAQDQVRARRKLRR